MTLAEIQSKCSAGRSRIEHQIKGVMQNAYQFNNKIFWDTLFPENKAGINFLCVDPVSGFVAITCRELEIFDDNGNRIHLTPHGFLFVKNTKTNALEAPLIKLT